MAPGGATDPYARLIAEHMARRLGRVIIVEHKPGGSGNVGTQYAAHEPADGNLILLTTQAMTEINPSAFTNRKWSLDEFIPLIRGVQAPLVLVANPTVPAKTLDELVAWIRKNPGKLSYSSGNRPRAGPAWSRPQGSKPTANDGNARAPQWCGCGRRRLPAPPKRRRHQHYSEMRHRGKRCDRAMLPRP